MKKALGWGLLALLAALVVLRGLLFDTLHVTGPDMVPTMATGDWFLVYRWARDPARGDLIVFEVPGSGGKHSVRRVIGLPGDKVEYKDQNVLVNGQPAHLAPEGTVPMEVGPLARVLDRFRETVPGGAHSYSIARDPQRHSKDQPVVTVPAGAYYVLADNRNHGRDAREYGPVPAASVRGTVVRRMLSLVRYQRVD